MAKLITKHDPYHVHKILGTFVLFSFLYRLFLVIKLGTAFPADQSPLVASLCVLVHGLLSSSSLLLPLPEKRNYSAPMIWPEFRLHSITFAMRHVLATILTIHNLWPDGLVVNAIARAGLLLCTVRVATWISDSYGDKEQRTTNAMSYPKEFSEEDKAGIKRQYTQAQFAATVAAICPDATINFWPLLGIQSAALLMTLVRKGKITALSYHRIYACTLFSTYIVAMIRIWNASPVVACAITWSGLWPHAEARFKWGVKKEVLWTLQVMLSWIVLPLAAWPLLQQVGYAEYSHFGAAFIMVGLPIQLVGYFPLMGITCDTPSAGAAASTGSYSAAVYLISPRNAAAVTCAAVSAAALFSEASAVSVAANAVRFIPVVSNISLPVVQLDCLVAGINCTFRPYEPSI